MCPRVLVNNDGCSFVSKCNVTIRQPLKVQLPLYETTDLKPVYLGLWLFLIPLLLNASILCGKSSCISHPKKIFYNKPNQKKTSDGTVDQPHLYRNILEN